MTALALLLIGGGTLMIYSGLTNQSLVKELRSILAGGNGPKPAPGGNGKAGSGQPGNYSAHGRAL